MLKVIAVGKIKEDYLSKGIQEYSKRIEGFQKFEIVEVKEFTTHVISKNIEEEGRLILDKISKDDYVITLEIEGKNISSVELSSLLDKLSTYGSSNITFVIGGSYGLSKDVKKRSNYALSFSNMTFPHQLMRLILLEQLYRAISILHHLEYHK